MMVAIGVLMAGVPWGLLPGKAGLIVQCVGLAVLITLNLT